MKNIIILILIFISTVSYSQIPPPILNNIIGEKQQKTLYPSGAYQWSISATPEFDYQIIMSNYTNPILEFQLQDYNVYEGDEIKINLVGNANTSVHFVGVNNVPINLYGNVTIDFYPGCYRLTRASRYNSWILKRNCE